MQYHCKNFPEMKRFETPYLTWQCDTRTYCSPAWHAQFPFDGQECKEMQWAANDDASVVARPLVSRAIDSLRQFAYMDERSPMSTAVSTRPDSTFASLRPRLPLLVLIFTEQANVARREWQRATWLSFKWHRSYLDPEQVPWRHIYVMSRREHQGESQPHKDERLNTVVGDTVTLANTTEGYANLVFKTMEALRWASAAVDFTMLLKVDDDSIVHVGRLWTWIFTELPKDDPSAPPPERLYAGRVFRGSQVIRKNFTRAHLWRPDWFPSSFHKWAVDFDVFDEESYPPYCGGGGYVLGRESVERILLEYDASYRQHSRIIQVEDAFVGVLARAQGIVPRDLYTFQEPQRGSLQTREMFMDQILVHRVVEPYKAFRWLMLSSNCHAGTYACAHERNRTHGVSSQDALPTSPDAAFTAHHQRVSSFGMPYDKDWISGAIPKADPEARTGITPRYYSSEPEPSPARTKKKKRRKDWQRRKRGAWRHRRNAHAQKNKDGA